jgi:polyhydroxyalkanoate synthesis regulator phasin
MNQFADLAQTVQSQQAHIDRLEHQIAKIQHDTEQHSPRIKYTLDKAKKNFQSWIQISKQQTLDATNEHLKEIREACFAQIDEEFELQASNLRSEMDCVRTHVKHVTREELALYKTKIRQYHSPPPTVAAHTTRQ